MNSRHTSRAAYLWRSLCAALLLLAYAPAAAQQIRDDASAAARPAPANGEITLTVTVTDEKGRYIGGLTREQVTITDEGVPREIKSFVFAAEPASVGVLFDISASMRAVRRNMVEDARRAFARFVSRASPQNEYFLWAFNKKVTELTGWTRGEAELNEGLNKIAPPAMPTKGSGGTALYDACAAALDKMASGSHRKRVLLILTDGGTDNASRQQRQLKSLKNKLRGSDVLVYPVAIFDRGYPYGLDTQGQQELDEIAAVSGGRAFFPAVSEVDGVIDRVAFELSAQYAISITPANAAKKGELNKLKIKIKPPPDFKGTLHVRTRDGYVSAPE